MKKVFIDVTLIVGLLLAFPAMAAPGIPPTITSFYPLSGAVGITVTIRGTNFNASPTNNIVFFGAVRATVIAASPTSLTVTVPVGATYEFISELNLSTALICYSASPFITTFTPARGYIATGDFLPKVDFAAGTNPRSVAIGDLDGDGKSDLAVVNTNSNTVSVYRNISTSGTINFSSFAAKMDFATGINPYSVAIGDLDGDGKSDLAVVNSSSSTVSVFGNTSTIGTISFSAKLDFSTGGVPLSVAIGDLDGDGKSDLAVANASSNTVSVFGNTSNSESISFSARVNFAASSSPNRVAIGDLDGDGKSDLAVTNYGSNTVSVFGNTSSGTINSSSFKAKVDFATGNRPYSVAIGDLDGDGKSDLAVINMSSNTVSVFHNTSTSGEINSSSFAAKVNFSTGDSPLNVVIGDLDGDSKSDLAVVNIGSSTVSVYRNTSTFGEINSSTFAVKVDFSTGDAPFSVAIGDLDGDGKSDLAVANFSGGSVSVIRYTPLTITLNQIIVYENQPSGTNVGTFSSTSVNPDAAFTYSLVGDIENTDNSLFSIRGANLLTAAELNYEHRSTYNILVRSTTQYGLSCDNQFSITISDVNEAPTLAAITNPSALCFTNNKQNIYLSGISNGPEMGQTFTMSVSSNNTALLSQLAFTRSDTSGMVTYVPVNPAGGTATISVTIKDNGGIDNGGIDTITRTFTVHVNPLPVVKISSSVGTDISKGVTAVLSASGGISYSWATANGIISGQNSATLSTRPSSTTTYKVTATNTSNCTSEQSITLNVNEDYLALREEINNILTPNGDGINDKLVIKNIDMYPNNIIKIFDRAGRLKYSKQHYSNEWDGTFNGAPLLTNTYYYILDFGPGIKPVIGFISLLN